MIYTYEVVYEDAKGELQSERYPHSEHDQAQAHYRFLPAERYKALWQTWRDPSYREALMILNYPRKNRGDFK